MESIVQEIQTRLVGRYLRILAGTVKSGPERVVFPLDIMASQTV
jgi:hypothetical protein